MRKTSMFLAAGAVLATVGLTVSSAMADPVGPPTFRAIVGVGSDTTQGVMNALSDAITINGTKILGSYDAAPIGSMITTRDPSLLPGCTINRPVGSGNGINALLTSENSPEGSGGGCLDYARSSNNDAASRPGTNLVYVPFATDAIAIATRGSTTLPNNLTIAQLQNLYNCVAPPPVGTFVPLLPQFGSGTRAFFLGQLGIPNTADIGTAGNRPCVRTTDANGNPLLENTGNLIFAANQLAPYAISSLIAQESREVPDVHGTAIMGSVAGTPSLLANPPAMGITYATRSSTTVPKSLTNAQLANLYNCVAPPPVGTFQPMLPANPASPVRVAFLSMIGVTTPGACVRTTDANGLPLTDNAGNQLFAANQLMPYDITAYINQQGRTVPDIHGTAILGEKGGTVPLVLNTATTMVRDVYNVLPLGYLPLFKIAFSFLSSSTGICANTAVIQRQGFATNPNCGSTAIQSGGPALTATTTTLDPLTAGANQTLTARVPIGRHGWIWWIIDGLPPVCVRVNSTTGVATTTANLNTGDSVRASFAPDNAIQVNGSEATATVP
jgi:hypothetical protein